MPDKIPSDIRALALSLHTDLSTLNSYAGHPVIAAALGDMMRGKLALIGAAIDNVEGSASVGIDGDPRNNDPPNLGIVRSLPELI